MSYLGTSIEQDITINTDEYIAIDNQTEFGIIYNDYVEVYLNGKLLSDTDYIATNGISVILKEPATKGDIIKVSGFASFQNISDMYEKVIPISANGTTRKWHKIGELRGGSANSGAELSFNVLNVNDYGRTYRQRMLVNCVQRGDNNINVEIFRIGQNYTNNIQIGTVQLGTYDFDIYLEQHAYNPCIITGHDSSFRGKFDYFFESLTEPENIVYASVYQMWDSSNTNLTFHSPTLVNSWVNYENNWETCQFSKNPVNNEVTIRGLIKGGSNSSNTEIFKLPPGYRPLEDHLTIQMCSKGYCRIDARTDGTVLCDPSESQDGDPNVWVTVNIKFIAGQ